MSRPGMIDYFLLILLALMWGSSFAFIKLGVHAYSPLVVAAGRITLGAIVLWGIVLLRRGSLPKGRGAWIAAFMCGLLGNAIPFFLISMGETRINAGLAAILMSVVPLTTVVLGHFVTRDEKLTIGKVLGLVLGTCGVVVLVGPETLSGLGGDLPYQLAVLVAAICYAISSLVARHVRDQPRAGSAALILTFASLTISPVALIVDQPWTMAWSAHGALAIAYLGVVPTGLAMFVLLLMVARTGAGFLAFNNYLVPAVGILVSLAVLGEVPAPSTLIAMVIILAGIAAANIRFGARASAMAVAPGSAKKD
ncbi:DMT family transporter [Thalassospira marina]|uniref:EamA family transporter n=1 Tax=Thalassospira marina TaxID=2048283 RepID=A0ABN5FE01_9PROT|nr:DMT family transporter [Thalassospira marina]AUG53203.1 EamA family transporter [Thalassospira marina]